jgi:hypothetical protein
MTHVTLVLRHLLFALSRFAFDRMCLRLALFCILAIAAALLAQPARAATITVTNTLDDGPGSLRQTVRDAVTGDTLVFSADVFSKPLTVTLTGGPIAITKSVTIDGSAGGAVRPAISGNNTNRILQVSAGTEVALSSLGVANGYCNLCVGGGILNNGVLSLTNVILSGNGADLGGGAVVNYGTLSVLNSTFTSNTSGAGDGGAVLNYGTMNLINGTFAGNSAYHAGGIYNSGTLVVLGNTIVNNSGTPGGIYSSGPLVIRSTIVAGSTGANCSGVPGAADGGYNLEDTGTCAFSLTHHSLSNVLSLLGVLGDYGGPVPTIPLLPGSPAIDASDPLACPAADARGVGRVGTCDIGAFESRGFAFNNQSGTPQTTYLQTAFALPLGLMVTSVYSEPVNGGQVTFRGPLSGASTQPATNVAAIEGGAVAQTVTANGIGGTYNVVASARGAAPNMTFVLSNYCPAVITVGNTNDSGPGSLRQAIASACTGGTVVFSPTVFGTPLTITLTSGQLTVSKTVTIDGWAGGAVTPTISGNNASRVFWVVSGTVAALNGLRIVNAFGPTYSDAGAIRNDGTLTVTHSTIAENHVAGVAGIFNNGTMVIMSSSIVSNTYNDGSGAIQNSEGARLAITGSSISHNRDGAGGMSNYGVLDLIDSIMLDNDGSWGGSIINYPVGTVNIVNTIIANCDATIGSGGISGGGALTLTNSTIVNNTGAYGGGLHNNGGTLLIRNSIVAANGGGNCRYSPNIIDGGNNIVDDDSCGFSVAHHSQPNTDPLLGTLGDYSGPVPTVPLLPGSPAIDAGNPLACPTQDARGVGRVATCDIGIYESRGFTFANPSGTSQSTYVNTAFPEPLVVGVSSTFNEPVNGGRVVFSAPLNGPSTRPPVYTTTVSAGLASRVASANGYSGTFTVTASARGVTGVEHYVLTSVDFPKHIYLATLIRQ